MDEDLRPAVKILMRASKITLLVIATNAGISRKGTKIDLAERIATNQELETERTWNAIVGGKHEAEKERSS